LGVPWTHERTGCNSTALIKCSTPISLLYLSIVRACTDKSPLKTSRQQRAPIRQTLRVMTNAVERLYLRPQPLPSLLFYPRPKHQNSFRFVTASFPDPRQGRRGMSASAQRKLTMICQHSFTKLCARIVLQVLMPQTTPQCPKPYTRYPRSRKRASVASLVTAVEPNSWLL